jgi:dedicator of cytokinesis protein 3
MIAVSIKVFHGDSKTVIKENPSLLKDTPVTQRLGFPDVVFPGDVRNEVYIKLWSGEFSFTNAGTVRKSLVSFANASAGPANIQITVEVRTRAGAIVERAISSGSGEAPTTQYQSLVFYRNNMPTFGELLKLSLPVDQLPHCHLFFTFRTRSGKDKSSQNSKNPADANERPFAFAYLPLFTNNIAIQDGSHILVLYRADRAGSMTPAEYFDAPPVTSPGLNPLAIPVPASVAKTAVPMKDHLVIRSLLCSTTYTSSNSLLGLLHWEEIADQAELSSYLSKFTFIGELEIVKFLTDIFDSLFNILVSARNQSGELDDLVFNALVTVLGIVQDRRFSNFQPVLDLYIDKHFQCAAASSHIIHSMNRLLANPTGQDTATPLRATLKVWHYVFRFIAKARELQKAKELGMGGGATADHLDSTFKRELRAHLTEVNRMMSSPTPSAIVGTQTFALKKFTSILPELAKIFNTVELVGITTSFANSIPPGGRGKLVIWKLIMYLQIVQGFLFDSPQARLLLVEAIVNYIRPHFGRFDEYSLQSNETEQAKDAARIAWLESTRLCISIIAVMLDKLQQALVDSETVLDQRRLRDEQGNVEYLLFLFPKYVA